MTLLMAVFLLLQDPATPPPAAPQTPAKPAEKTEGEKVRKEWEYTAQVYGYRVRDDRDYLQPTFTADQDWLHLEARYNYEDHDTGSAWMGVNLSVGSDLKLDITPMVGIVFGHTAGVAPGFKATLTWWRLELYSEYEYVFDTGDHYDSFSYTWTELTISVFDWLSLGGVVQRTRVYETDFDSQRGFLVRVFASQLEITFCYFNPTEDPVYVLGLGFHF